MSMERSRSQVMFQFLPGNTFDYSGSRGIWKVTQLETSAIGGEIDRQYILNRIRHRVENWDGGYIGFDNFQSDFYHFGRPDGVLAEPFPLTFECKRCHRAHQFYDVDDLEDSNPELTCADCGRDLRQYQFVSVHSCGRIEGLNLPGCQNGHGRQHIELNTRGSQKASKFKWECTVGGCGWSGSISWYQNCDCDYAPSAQATEESVEEPDGDDGDRMYTTVHRAGSVYYPHYLTTVNLRSANLGQLRTVPEGIQRGFARFFDIASEDVPVDSINLDAETNPEEVDDERAASLIVERDDISSFEEAKQHLRDSGELTSQSLSSKLDELIALENDSSSSELDAAGDEVLQYSLSIQELTTHTLDDLSATARQRGFPTRADRIQAYHEDLERLGLEETRVIEDFPIQTFVYGFTRGSRREARINPFSSHASDGDGTPIFVDTAETEGVQFDLDPAEVLLWLACNFPDTANGQLVNGPVTLPEVNPDSSDSVRRAREQIEELGQPAQRAFVLNHLPDVDEYGRFSMDTREGLVGDLTESIFKLIHTMSHILLKQASTISGFDRTNLSEFLFPRALSFVIYANNRDEFNMGGMTTMVEQQLDTLLGQAVTTGNDCLYDPVCSHRGSACLSCLHVSEISCSYFNQVLSRDYLFGSRQGTGRDIVGYWPVTRQ